MNHDDGITLESLRKPHQNEGRKSSLPPSPAEADQLAAEIAGLRRYQGEVMFDDSQFIAWVKSRQIGGSWCAGAKVADNAAETGQDWILLSRSMRQSKRLLKKVALHVRAQDQIRTKKYGAPSLIENIGTEQIEMKNGAAIMAMPCDDETTVGDAANVLLDEFALFPNSEDVFSALTPCIMNGYRIIALSSPRGKKGMFAKIFSDSDNGWSKHKTTIFDAERGGLILRDQKGNRITAQEFIDNLRRKGMSEAKIRQEFLCEFLDEATAFLTLEMIRSIQDDSLSKSANWERLRRQGLFFVGVDIGRYNDPTVIWIWELIDNLLVCRGCIEMLGRPFEEQERRVREIIAHPSVKRCCIDATGLGLDIAERLSDRKKGFPTKVERCTFTQTFKEEIAINLKSKAERRELLIPQDEAILQDWHSIEQEVTSQGNFRYTASRSSGSHADRFWAAGLGIHACRNHKPFELTMAFGE